MTLEGMRRLRDPAAAAPLLAMLPVLAEGRAALGRVTIARVGVKPGRMFHVLYDLALEVDGTAVHTQAWVGLLRADDDPVKILRRTRRVTAPEAPGWVTPSWDAVTSSAVVEDARVVVQLFPWDYRLRTLAEALDPARVGDALGWPVARATVAGYWPGRRCQVRYTPAGGGGPRFGKLLSYGGAAELRETLAPIARAVSACAADRIRVPPVLAYVSDLELLVTGEVPGTSVATLCERAETAGVMGRVADALATFHALEVPEVTRTFGMADEVLLLRGWVPLASALCPSLAGELTTALAVIERAAPLPLRAARPSLVHRDLYDKQVHVDGDVIAFLDLDTACQGEAELDVANFGVHLLLRAWRDGTSIAVARSEREEFVGTYRHRRAVEGDRLAWYGASALLRLACVYAVRPGYGTLPAELVAESRRVLAEEVAA